jgi:hypothetical protein
MRAIGSGLDSSSVRSSRPIRSSSCVLASSSRSVCLRGDVPGDPEGPDDASGEVPQRLLGRAEHALPVADAHVPLVQVGDGQSGADNLLLVGEGRGGVLRREVVEVGLAHHRRRRLGADQVRLALADPDEPGLKVFEVDRVRAGRQQIEQADLIQPGRVGPLCSVHRADQSALGHRTANSAFTGYLAMI